MNFYNDSGVLPEIFIRHFSLYLRKLVAEPQTGKCHMLFCFCPFKKNNFWKDSSLLLNKCITE